jgi:hypothetical protein
VVISKETQTAIKEVINEYPRYCKNPVIAARSKNIVLFTFIFGSNSYTNCNIEYGNILNVSKN